MQTVLSEYRSRGNAFLFDVFNSAKYLEELTGINEAFHVRDDDEVTTDKQELQSYNYIAIDFYLLFQLLELNDSESDWVHSCFTDNQ